MASRLRGRDVDAAILVLVLLQTLLLLSHAFRRPSHRTTSPLVGKSLLRYPTSMSVAPTAPVQDQQFGLGKFAFSLVPLSPEAVGRRQTLFKEIVPGKIWTLDQIQGIINVNVPVRSTIIRLSDGGLFVNNPVAPTKECVRYVRELEKHYGAVKYIALSSIALEHKGTAGAFARFFPKAAIYLQPGQYSFPIDLPSQLFFPFGRTVKEIPETNVDAPWAKDIDHAILGPLRPPGIGGFAETAYFHRETKTLLVTDTITKITEEPPEIIAEDPRAILYHARDTMLEIVQDTPANRRKGWRRMVLFGFFFQPGGIDVKDTFAAIKMLKDVDPSMKKLGEGAIPYDGGLYPWDWVKDDKPSFAPLANGLTVAPILQTLILNREPGVVNAWLNRVCAWPFTRIIPSHLNNDVKASPAEVRRAFDFLYEERPNTHFLSLFDSMFGSLFGSKPESVVGRRSGSNVSGGVKKKSEFVQEDIQFLQDISKQLTEQGILYPEGPLLKR